MDERRVQQHEQAISYWRNVARQGQQEEVQAQQHIRAERQEEDAETARGRQGHRV
jgi:hypothetical protein